MHAPLAASPESGEGGEVFGDLFCSAVQQVGPGSILDEVTGFLSSCTDHSSRAQPLTEMRTRNLPGNKGRPTPPTSDSRLSNKFGSVDVSGLHDFLAATDLLFF
jgi:hypothetical protein